MPGKLPAPVDNQSEVVPPGQGNDDSRMWFEDQIRTRYPKIKIIQPEPGKSVEV